MLMSASKGLIRQHPSFGKSNMAETTNSLGWEVQKYVRGAGWKNASPIVKTEGLAEVLLTEMPKEPDTEYRVYEALVFPVQAGKV